MAQSDDPAKPSLLKGGHMLCPKCEVENNVLAFRPLGTIEKYEHETNPIVKCPNCGWLFSPGIDEGLLERAFEALRREYGYGGRADSNLAAASSGRHLRPVEESA